MNGSLEKDDSILEEVEGTGMDQANNKSMMTVAPSQNYKQLLHDFSQLQGSSDLVDEEGQFFDIDEGNSNHQESQEVVDVIRR